MQRRNLPRSEREEKDVRIGRRPDILRCLLMPTFFSSRRSKLISLLFNINTCALE